MKENKIIEYLLKSKGIDLKQAKDILREKSDREDIFSFLLRKGIISYADLKNLVNLDVFEENINKESLKKYGISFEDAYFVYQKDEEDLYIVPYRSINGIEKKGGTLYIHIGGLEKVVIKLEEDLINAFLDSLLLYISRSSLR